MKISSFYLMNIDDYNDIIVKITKDIEEKFYGIGKSSLSIGHFISYLREVLFNYLKLKYKKNYKVILTLPTIDEKLAYKEDYADNVIRIKLNRDKIVSILEGDYYEYDDYINEIIDQVETELTSRKKFNLKDYLVIQMDGLVIVAQNELSKLDKEYVLKAILDKKEWNTLTKTSAIFNEYYNAHLLCEENKVIFARFLKKLYLEIKNGG